MRWILLITMGLMLVSCRPARHLQVDEQLLNRTKVNVAGSEFGSGDLKPILSQTSNKRSKLLFNMRFRLALYNFLNRGKPRQWKEKLAASLGEEPVVYDEYMSDKSVKRILQYLRNYGYYNATASYDTVQHPNRKKVNLVFTVDPGQPHRIHEIQVANNWPMFFRPGQPATESKKKRLFYNPLGSNQKAEYIRTGMTLEAKALTKEQKRIVRFYREQGYYAFSKQNVYFEVDTTKTPYVADIKMVISPKGDVDVKKYQIDYIYVYPDYDPAKALANPNYMQQADTVKYGRLYFIQERDPYIKHKTIARNISLQTGAYYKLSQVEQSHRLLAATNAFRIVDIDFAVLDDQEADTIIGHLACSIKLTPTIQQSFQVEAEGTNSSGNLGVAGNLKYQHRSVFGGAEDFKLKLRGALEAQTLKEAGRDTKFKDQYLLNTYEYGAEAELGIPRLVAPYSKLLHSRGVIGKTSLTTLYNYQQRPDYKRVLSTLSFGYRLKRNNTLFLYNPVSFNYVDVDIVDTTTFFDRLVNNPARYSYQNQMIGSGEIGFTFNNQISRRDKRNNWFVRVNLESAGALLQQVSTLLDRPMEHGYYEFTGIRYSEFIKTDIDVRYYAKLTPPGKRKANTLALRTFVGFGYPYGNTNESMPFVKQYYAGGANSIRAWQVRSLGPGSYVDTLSTHNIANQTSDIKIEMNAEYRFHMFWMLDGAVYVDAGNIWAFSKSDTRKGAAFRLDRFMDDVAVGTGFGMRLDFTYFLIRFDFGLKLRNPVEPEIGYWIPFNRAFGYNDWTFNVGIGYPF